MKLFYTLILLVIILPGGAAQNVLFVANGAALTTTGGVVITLQDMDLRCDGTINQLPGNGKFVFNGTAGTLLSGASRPLFDLLEIAKAGGAGISLNQSVSIGTSIYFTSGLINLSGGNVYLQQAAVLNGETETSHITGTAGGYVEISEMLNAPAAANPGNLGAVITSTENLGNTVIRRGHEPQNTGNGNSIARWYNILPANDNALNATLRLSYFKSELNGLADNSLTVWKSTDSLTWTSKGSTASDPVSRYVETSGLNDLSWWTLAGGVALPVQFTAFIVTCERDDARISWQTASEENSNHFDVLFSSDGTAWRTIGTVPAAGNSALPSNYAFTDDRGSGTGFYRVAEFDNDGRAIYTGIAHADCNLATDNLSCWPNPVQGQLTVSLRLTGNDQVLITVLDNHGATVRQQANALSAGNNQVSVNMNGLASGIYIIQVLWGGNLRTMRVLKER
jgi:hypothetical protein